MPIHKTEVFDCTPAQLWEIVGTPDRVDWVPGVTDCEFDGEVRSLSLPGAGFIREKILSRDADAMTMSYSCIESPAPLQRHLASVEVRGANGKAELIWKTEVEPVAVEPFIEASMDGAIQQIKSLIGAGA